MKTVRNAILAASLTLIMTSPSHTHGADTPKIPAVGDKAPLITGLDQNGKSWALAEFLGRQAVLLYFYPKDDTPGCTTQACGLRDRIEDLQSKQVQVVGVSFDSVASHQKFRDKYQLNFTLLADTEGKIADAFGARRAPEAKTARRVSFLIGRDGRIVHVTDHSSATVHLDEMKAAIEKLASQKS